MTSTPASIAAGELPVDRLRALDGLRGVAAFSVLIHHSLFLLPALDSVQRTGSAAGQDLWVWLLAHTPLHLMWAGEEAVLVFFVLSGVVLTLPWLDGRVQWRAYYPRRLVRLYVPVWGAVALAVLLAAVVPRDSAPGRSPWLTERGDVDLADGWTDAVLLTGASALNTPLWSLQWEVVFSLLLPVFLLAARGGRWRGLLWGVLLVAAVGVGTVVGSAALRYLPVFGLGVLVAAHRDETARLAGRIQAGRRPRLVWWGFGGLAVVLLTSRWLVAGLPEADVALEVLSSGATIAGAVLAVVLAMHWPGMSRALQAGPVQWCGTRSFSLYLVHEPLVVSLGFLLPLAAPPVLGTAAAIPVALLVAAVFYRVVEAPAHRAARAVGHRARRVGPAPAPGRSRRAAVPARRPRSAVPAAQPWPHR